MGGEGVSTGQAWVRVPPHVSARARADSMSQTEGRLLRDGESSREDTQAQRLFLRDHVSSCSNSGLAEGYLARKRAAPADGSITQTPPIGASCLYQHEAVARLIRL